MMRIALLRETKTREGRVALIPDQIAALVKDGNQVFVQKDAGVKSFFSNKDYQNAGAKIVSQTKELIQKADLVIKVKEPTLQELGYARKDQIFFCYLHLAAFPDILKKILDKRIMALGYETVQLKDGSLPLLAPMSEIAGKLATQNGAHYLRADQGGRGVLIGGTETVAPAQVLVLGGGYVGENAAKMAIGLGAKTIVLDTSSSRRKALQKKYGKKLFVYPSTAQQIKKLVPQSDLVIGAVLLPGEKAPKLVSKKLVQQMKEGSVLVDVSVDQGGCCETSVVTSHDKPVVKRFGVLHYGVPNMPGSVPVTGTKALSTATFPYIRQLAKLGYDGCVKKFPEMKLALNCLDGQIMHPGLKK